MYAQHFGLTHEPFSIAPDPRFLYMSERHREALAHLLYGLGAGGGFVLLSGEIGAGKTTVCRCFLEQVPPGCHVAYIFNPKLSVIELLQTVCDEFGLQDAVPAGATSIKAYVDVLNRFLLRAHAAGESCVLIIDEAQNLSADVLEQLRLLTNLETQERKLLQIILIGQPELRALIATPALEQLAQRVIARYHLQALSEVETAAYVRHRLGVAGLNGPMPFDAAVLRRIHRASRGIPRRINLLCDRALLGAYGDGRSTVDGPTLDAAAAEVFDHPPPRPRRAALNAALGLLAVVGLGAVLVASWRSSPVDPAGQPVAALHAPVPASAPASPAAAASAIGVLAVRSLEALEASQPWRDEAQAWRALGQRWQIDIVSDQPCQTVETLGLACYRSHNTLGALRQLDRPVLLALRQANGAEAGWALLTALNGDHATLRLSDGPVVVPLTLLGARWRGDFATLWRPPAGNDAEQAAWMRERLRKVLGAAWPEAANPRQGIEAFQVAHGLKADGVAGPMTLMHLNRAAGEPEPRLDRE